MQPFKGPWVVSAVALLAIGGLVGCGDDSDSETTSSRTSGANNAAEELLERYQPEKPFEVEALSERPDEGKVVAVVNCNVPDCNPGGSRAPIEALGWTAKDYPFDVLKGPQDFQAQFKRALADRPDYIMATITFGDDVALETLAAAEAAGIPVIGIAGTNLEAGYAGIVQSPKTQWSKMGEAVAALTLTDGEAKEYAIATDPAIANLKFTEDEMRSFIEENSDAQVKTLELSLSRTPEDNAAATQSFLQRNPNVSVVMYTASAVSVGAVPILRGAGLLDRVKLYLAFVNVAALPDIKSGGLAGGVSGEYNFFWRAVHMLAQISVGDTIPDREPVGEFTVIREHNATEDQLDPVNYQAVYKTAWRQVP